MHTHHYITTGTAHISQWHLQLHLISPSQVSSPAVQLFPFFQGKTEAWWHLLLLSGDSGMCVFVCADVCVHLSISVLLLHLPKAWWSLYAFSQEKASDAFLAQSEMETKPRAVLGLAYSYPNDTVTQGGNPSKRHLHLYHMTDAAFGMPD